jgi:hypothetical protein
MAWAVVVVLAGALVLVLPNHENKSSTARLWSPASAGVVQAHSKTPDAEGPISDEACSDRDYANERC